MAVARVDLERRELDFRVVERKKGKAPISTKHTKGTKKRPKVEAKGQARNAAVVVSTVGCHCWLVQQCPLQVYWPT